MILIGKTAVFSQKAILKIKTLKTTEFLEVQEKWEKKFM